MMDSRNEEMGQNTNHDTENNEILRELPDSEWPLLRDVFKDDWPYAIYTYYIVENFIYWKKKDANVKVKILCPTDGYRDGTMLLIHTTKNLTTIYPFTLEKSCRKLHECLVSSKQLIDWAVEPLVHLVHQDHWDMVKSALVKLKLGTDFQYQTSYHWISKSEADKFEISAPSDVFIGPLGEKNIKTMNDLWPHRYPESESLIRDLLRLNGGLGIFSKDDQSLRCWIVKNKHHGLGMLQTVDEYKRRGYGRLLIMAMSKEMAKDGFDIHACIVNTNHVSLGLFRSLGFKKVDNLMSEKVKAQK